MSRIGKSIIEIPSGVTVEVIKGGEFDHEIVKVSGPKGELQQSTRRGISLKQEGNQVEVVRADDTKANKSFHGLYRTLINNMILGVTQGYAKELHIEGIGYRAELQGDKLVMSLGYSHKIEVIPPQGISIEVNDQTELKISGIDKQAVGDLAAKIRGYRKPEPYKGKGVRYKDEQIRRKSVKSGK